MIHQALIYDGSGHTPYPGSIAIDGDRLSYVGPSRRLKGRRILDAHGQAAAPGFIDMIGHSEESLLIDGRAVSGLKQGVTLDIFTEQSFGPLNPDMAPSPPQLESMRKLVTEAMQQGALGLTTALIYAPMNYAQTPELTALAGESARCGGIYTAHMRSEGDHIEAAIHETIDIARGSGAPAEIHHRRRVPAISNASARLRQLRTVVRKIRAGAARADRRGSGAAAHLAARRCAVAARARRLRPGAFADVVIFDPATFQDHATYEKPLQYATGVSNVIINGTFALADGQPTGAASGRVVRGRAWTGAPGGGCRNSSHDWSWANAADHTRATGAH